MKRNETKRRFFLDDDGTFLYKGMTNNYKEEIRIRVEEIPDGVTTYLLCSNIGGKFLHLTETGEILSCESYFSTAHSQGVDLFALLINELKKKGKEVLITYRLNDVHEAADPNSLDERLIADFKKNNKGYTIGENTEKNCETYDTLDYCFDYSKPEVRKYILATIKELIELYNIDGLQLDWMRFPRYLSGSPDEVWEKRGILTEFVSNVREILDSKKKGLILSSRIPSNIEGCKYLGLDIIEWKEKEMVDFFVLSPFLTTDFYMPVQEIREFLGNSTIPLYTSFDIAHGYRQVHCPESLRAAIASLNDCGSDGIYLFNFPALHEYNCSLPYYWLDGMYDPMTIVSKPLLISIPNNNNRIKHVDMEGQLPVKLSAKERNIFNYFLPKACFPVNKIMFLVEGSGTFEFIIGNHRYKEIDSSFYRNFNIFMEHSRFLSKNNKDSFMDITAYKGDCIKCFIPDHNLLIHGINKFEIINTGESESEISRINIGIW